MSLLFLIIPERGSKINTRGLGLGGLQFVVPFLDDHLLLGPGHPFLGIGYFQGLETRSAGFLMRGAILPLVHVGFLPADPLGVHQRWELLKILFLCLLEFPLDLLARKMASPCLVIRYDGLSVRWAFLFLRDLRQHAVSLLLLVLIRSASAVRAPLFIHTLSQE